MAKTLRNIIFTSTARPTHSYMKYLYKYPQRAAYPSRQPNEKPTITARGTDMEYELLDTGIFDTQ